MAWKKGQPRPQHVTDALRAGYERARAEGRILGWPKGKTRGPLSEEHREKLRQAALGQKRPRNKKLTKRTIILEAKAKPCHDCGRSYPYYVMDLDHSRGEKAFELGSTPKAATVEQVQAEIEKCDAVCSNCHRERTHRRACGTIQ